MKRDWQRRKDILSNVWDWKIKKKKKRCIKKKEKRRGSKNVASVSGSSYLYWVEMDQYIFRIERRKILNSWNVVSLSNIVQKKNVRIIREKNRVILQTPSSWKFQSILILLLHKKYCLTFRNVFQKKKKYRYRSNFLLKLFKYIIKEVVRA